MTGRRYYSSEPDGEFLEPGTWLVDADGSIGGDISPEDWAEFKAYFKRMHDND